MTRKSRHFCLALQGSDSVCFTTFNDLHFTQDSHLNNLLKPGQVAKSSPAAKWKLVFEDDICFGSHLWQKGSHELSASSSYLWIVWWKPSTYSHSSRHWFMKYSTPELPDALSSSAAVRTAPDENRLPVREFQWALAQRRSATLSFCSLLGSCNASKCSMMLAMSCTAATTGLL